MGTYAIVESLVACYQVQWFTGATHEEAVAMMRTMSINRNIPDKLLNTALFLVTKTKEK